jgi:hypothetical protein
MLVGQSHAVANMSVGQLTLDPIKFNVTSSLNGLGGLKGMTTIGGVDVMGGTTEAMQLNINSRCLFLFALLMGVLTFVLASIYNPSNLNLQTGDLSEWFFRSCVVRELMRKKFCEGLALSRSGGALGTVLLSDLKLNTGNNTFTATSDFQASNCVDN